MTQRLMMTTWHILPSWQTTKEKGPSGPFFYSIAACFKAATAAGRSSRCSASSANERQACLRMTGSASTGAAWERSNCAFPHNCLFRHRRPAKNCKRGSRGLLFCADSMSANQSRSSPLSCPVKLFSKAWVNFNCCTLDKLCGLACHLSQMGFNQALITTGSPLRLSQCCAA